jgi:hypothetical protein
MAAQRQTAWRRRPAADDGPGHGGLDRARAMAAAAARIQLCPIRRPQLNLSAACRDTSQTGALHPGAAGGFQPRRIAMISKMARASILAVAVAASTASVASARTVYDGRWSLSIVTQRGACDSYKFPVEINNGHVSFPGLNKASGRVAANGAVRVFVSAGGKSASGSGRLSPGAGSGRWSGRSGSDRCSGIWTAQRG